MVSDILADHGTLFLGSRLKRLADRMQAEATVVLDRLGLGIQPPQVALLAALDRFGPIGVGEAAEALGISQPAVTRIVGSLCGQGLVRADRGVADQRQKRIDLTDDGRALVERIKRTLWPPVKTAADALCADLAGSFLQQVELLETRLAERSLVARVEAARQPTTVPAGLRIVEYTDDLAPVFAEITREWIEHFFSLEQHDRDIIGDPKGTILDRGGFILFVEAEGLGIVGTCALIKIEEGVFELTKMGVRASARGRKAGEFLLAAVLKRAQAMRLDELFLLTSAKLAPAIHLYEKAGFRHDAEIMRRHGARYARCDVAMRYPLRAVATVRPARGTHEVAAMAMLFRAYEASLGIDLSSQDFSSETAGLPGKYAPPTGELLIARDRDGSAIGCVALRAFDATRCEMKRLFVRPEARGTGAGRRLVDAALAFAEAAGYREMVLDTLPRLAAAVALYESVGFEQIAPYWNNVIPTTVYYRKALR